MIKDDVGDNKTALGILLGNSQQASQTISLHEGIGINQESVGPSCVLKDQA